MAKTLTRRVVKATSMLGSTQVLNMLCSVVRMKLLSLWVGPFGVGLMGVFTQTSELFVNLTQLNIRTTAVRDLAVLPPESRGETIGVVRRISRALGWLGVVLMILLAPLLSRFSFGSGDYAWAFRLLSLTLVLQALQGGEHIILQAEGRYKSIAASSLLTSVIGLAAAIPLYWLLRSSGIVPSLLCYGLAAWLSAAWFSRPYRSAMSASDLSLRECFRRSSGFIRLGFYTVLANIVANVVNLGFLAVVQRSMGDTEMGLYQAGNTMLIRYVGVFFIAIGLEFYPRLSAAAGRPRHASLLMAHQARVQTALFFPCAVAAILLAPWLIRLLYREDFLPMAPYFIYGMVGMMFRPASMVLSYGFLAMDKARPYLVTEIVSSVTGFLLSLAGYHLGGFAGLGIATALWYLIDILVIYLGCHLSGTPRFPVRTLMMALGSGAVIFVLAFALVQGWR